MKKSELKRLIKEVVEEVYSQQDEGIMDFLKDPTGKKRARAKAEKEREEEETRSNKRNATNKEIHQKNIKRLASMVEGMRLGYHVYQNKASNVDTAIDRARSDLHQAGAYEEHGIWEPNKRSQYGDRRGDDAVSAYDSHVSTLRDEKKKWENAAEEAKEMAERVKKIYYKFDKISPHVDFSPENAEEFNNNIKFLENSQEVQTIIYAANRHKDTFWRSEDKENATKAYNAYNELEQYIV